MDPNAAKPDNPNIVNPGLEPPVTNVSSDPLSNLQNVVDAAKQAAAVQTPQGQFMDQFGSGPATPPIVDNATVPGLIDTALANLGTPPEQTQPVVETLPQPELEQTPAEKLKQQISDSVDAFLEEVLRKQGVTS